MDAKKIIKFLFLNVIGSILYGVGIHSFTAPQHIAPGGASGIGILVNYVSGFPIGLFTFLFNIPLLILAYRFVTKKFFYNALFSITLFSFITDYVVTLFPVYAGDALLACIFGGALMGVGLALVHMTESTTGGLTILGVILQKKYPQFEVGKLIFVLNLTVVAASAFVFNNIESVLYAVIAIYISSMCMDSIVCGLNKNKFVVIISDHNEEVKAYISDTTHKGFTILNGVGGYSECDKQVIFCAIGKNEYVHVKKMIHTVDPNAFVIITDASEVIGNGFKSMI
ncbi:MAG: YitT family protein [Niameybacter sp.]|uniref:YitT family protein n=1 Tax=Niameybacter sp. TaxID=2033640 RepID=UPI002FC993BD